MIPSRFSALTRPQSADRHLGQRQVRVHVRGSSVTLRPTNSAMLLSFLKRPLAMALFSLVICSHSGQ